MILGTPVGRALAAPDGVAGSVDGPGLYPWLTARQNLAALAALRVGGARSAGIDDVLHQVGLTDVADERVRGYPGDDKLFAPDDVPGAYIPSAENDG